MSVIDNKHLKTFETTLRLEAVSDYDVADFRHVFEPTNARLGVAFKANVFYRGYVDILLLSGSKLDWGEMRQYPQTHFQLSASNLGERIEFHGLEVVEVRPDVAGMDRLCCRYDRVIIKPLVKEVA